MFTLSTLRHSFAAALGAVFLTIFIAGFLLPNSVIICDFGGGIIEPRFSRARIWYGSETDLVVTIKRDGTILVGKRIVPPSRLEEIMLEEYRIDSSRVLVLRADVRSPFGATRAVVRVARSLGIPRVVIPSGVRSVGDYWAQKPHAYGAG